MNNSLIDVIHSLALDIADAQYTVDVLEAVIKQHKEEDEIHYAAFIFNNAGDQEKALSSSSTVSLKRKAIEADIALRFGYKPIYDVMQEQLDLAAANQRVRQLRAEHTMYTMRYYGEFADAFGTMQNVFAPEQLHSQAQQALPVVPAPRWTPQPVRAQETR